ncbi:hypothetical protein F5Y03DRAFT_363497 [Xylaria venustula]|nr:hypothetical protein F5Y03DRAFT_363497 [Xylaria venustula]
MSLSAVARAEDAPQQQNDDDEDNLSIASTNAEENDSEKEWEVDDVLAERPHPDIPGASQYLIKWEGFKLEDCTWEPVEHLGDGLLAKWEENRAEIGAGKRQMFDLATFDTACAERLERHRRRNAKRRRLGLPLTPPFLPEFTDDTPVASPMDVDSPSSDEAEEADEVDPANIPPPKAKATAGTSIPPTATTTPAPISTVRRVVKQTTFIGIPSQASSTDSRTSKVPENGRSQKPSLPHPNAASKTSASSTSSVKPPAPGLPRKVSSGTMTGYQGTAGRSSVFKATGTKMSTQNASTLNNKSLTATTKPPASSSIPTKALKAKRSTALKTPQLPSSFSTNVFAGGTQRKQRASLGEAMVDPSKTPKKFSTMRVLNIAKKRGIEKGDAVGALSSIPSKFIIGNEQANVGFRKPSLVSSSTVASPQNLETASPASAVAAHDPQVEAQLESSAPKTLYHQHEEEAAANQNQDGIRQGAPPSILSTQRGGPEGVPPPKRKKSVRFTEVDRDELASTIKEPFDDTVHMSDGITNPDADSGAQAPFINVLKYQEREQTQKVQKLVKFGNAEAITVSFGGITRHTPAWLSAFKNEQTLHLSSTCSAFHFLLQKQHLIKEKLSAGSVTAHLTEHASALKNVADSLQQNSIGLHLVTREYSILVYPTRCDGWDWLDVDSKKPNEDVLLRHIIFLSHVPPRAYPSELDPVAANELIHPKGRNDIELVELLTELDFSKMSPQDPTLANKQAYMLLLPLKARQTLGVIMAWLRFHQPDRPIFTVEQPHSWRLFHEAVQAGGGGTIISHATFTLWKLERIASVWRMLENHKYTFWHLDTGENERPQYPSSLDAISKPGTLRLTRLFPYGRAFLITPSFAISEPAKLCEFLKWFKQWAANPSHIIVTCHDFPRFLRNITEEKQKERSALLQMNPGNKDVEIYLKQTCRTERDIDYHFHAWELFQEIMEQFGDEETSEEIRKIHYLSEYIDPSDEQSLVNAFCWWTQLKCDRFRRFYVLGSNPSHIQAAYRYIEIPRYFNTEGSDPDTASILLQRRLLALQLQKEADRQGMEANIAWNTDGLSENSVCEAPFHFPSPLFRTDDAHELRRWIEYHNRGTSMNWSTIHQKPVSWKDLNMADQFLDSDGSRFDTFDGWFKAAPTFSPKRNTYYGLFYTITEVWDEYMPRRRYERHPWIAIYRPKNPHLLRKQEHFSRLELFIWDVAAADRGKTGNYLLDMQCQLIDYVYSSIPKHYHGCFLSDVWYSSSTNLEFGPNENALDITCRRIQEMFNNSKEELAPYDKLLLNKWTPIDAQSCRSGLSPMTLRTTPLEKPSALSPKRIPQTEEDKLKPQRAIWHPGPGRTRERGTRCLNDLHETCLKARLENPKCNQIEYRYRPTQEWWTDQVKEGRGCGYVSVDVAGVIIDRLPKKSRK